MYMRCASVATAAEATVSTQVIPNPITFLVCGSRSWEGEPTNTELDPSNKYGKYALVRDS